jgi:hypothetical protein
MARKRPSEFRKTTRCPVCHGDACLVTGPKSAPVAVVCRRTTSPKQVANLGWLHVLDQRGPVFQFTPAGIEVGRMVREAAQ